MSLSKSQKVLSMLLRAATGETDLELYLDAVEVIQSLEATIIELEAQISNQRTEIARLHRVEGVY